MNRDLVSKTALVTGSGRNIGRAIALEFASRGANVIVNSRSNVAQAQEVTEEARQLGVKAIAVVGDVSAQETIDEIAARSSSAGLEPVAIYVSNSSARPVIPLASVTPEQWQEVVDVQLRASFLLARAFVPGMVEKRWGRIIHITGPSAFLGVPNRPHVAAKGGLRGLTKSLAIELGPYGITVNDVAPGEIRGIEAQAMSESGAPDPRHDPHSPIPVGRTGKPEDIAYGCGFLASPRAAFFTGLVLVCSGGQWMAP